MPDPKPDTIGDQLGELSRLSAAAALDELEAALERLRVGDLADAAERSDEAAKQIRRALIARSHARMARQIEARRG